jgi:hypothetical protein
MPSDVWLAPGDMRLTASARLGFFCVSLVALALACDAGTQQKHKLRNGPVGLLKGEIELAPGSPLPKFAAMDIVRRPLQIHGMPPAPSECVEANEEARTPVKVTDEGLLSGIVVAASDFTRLRERLPKEHKVAIEHCRLKPNIVAAQGGDILKLENKDAYGFEPLIGPAYESHALPRDKVLKFPLVASGIDVVQCSLGAPCGRTDLLVFHHPVHTVSDDKGHFTIKNFPAGELVRVTAWHPLFEPTETFVWIDPGQTNSVKIQLTPKTRFTSAPSAPSAPSDH